MPHYLACIGDDGTVTVASDVPEGFEPTAPWVVVDAAGLEAMREAAESSFVPKSVTARQIRLWLVRQGVSLASVEAAIESIADPVTRDSVRVEWEYAPYVERSHPWLVPLAASLGLTAAQVDAAFREAATL